MKMFKRFIMTIVGILFLLQTTVGQNLIEINSTSQAKMFSERLSAYINSQDGQALFLNQWVSSAESDSYISQTFEYEEFYVSIRIWIQKNQEWATHKYQTSLRFGGNGSGYKLTDLGDEAQGWNTGNVKLRKGNVFIDIGMTLKADLDNKSDNAHSLTEQEKQAKEELENQQSQEIYHQLMKEPWVQSTTLPKRVPNYSPEHKLAQQFARYVLEFLETYSR